MNKNEPPWTRMRGKDAIALGWWIGVGLFLCVIASVAIYFLIQVFAVSSVALLNSFAPTAVPTQTATATPAPNGIADIVMIRRQDGAFYVFFVLTNVSGRETESDGIAHFAFNSSTPSDTYEISYNPGEYGFSSPTTGPIWLQNSAAAKDYAVVAYLGPIYHYTHTEIAEGSIVTIELKYTLRNGTTLSRQEKVVW